MFVAAIRIAPRKASPVQRAQKSVETTKSLLADIVDSLTGHDGLHVQILGSGSEWAEGVILANAEKPPERKCSIAGTLWDHREEGRVVAKVRCLRNGMDAISAGRITPAGYVKRPECPPEWQSKLSLEQSVNEEISKILGFLVVDPSNGAVSAPADPALPKNWLSNETFSTWMAELRTKCVNHGLIMENEKAEPEAAPAGTWIELQKVHKKVRTLKLKEDLDLILTESQVIY